MAHEEDWHLDEETLEELGKVFFFWSAKIFHQAHCPSTRSGCVIHSCTVAEARRRGWRPCRVCFKKKN